MSEKSNKLIFSIKFILTAIVAITVFIAVVLMILDTPLLNTNAQMVVMNNIKLGEGNLGGFDAVLAGLILSVLPIFLIVVFTMTSAMILLGLLFVLGSIILALVLPIGIMGLPLLLIIGLVWLIMRNKKQDS